ncbi:MAG: MBL fold metallo-hydrolase [Chloroflexi bacterium]|nr:MBL fold metallo-hydrolase [Chloroflexota bacterium]
MFRIGDIEVYLFNDATTYMDPGGVFGLVPRVLWSRYYSTDDRHLIKSANHNLLVRAAGRNIIVDTGFGNCLSETQRARRNVTHHDGTHAGLAALGISSADIDIVIDTHLHDDHCSGNFRLNADGLRQPAFPKATYLVQRREYEDAASPNERTRATYLPDNYVPLFDSGQLQLLDGDSDIVPGVTVVVTPGHTPAHMSVRIESAGQHAAFLCDLASMAIHFERLAWMTAYDVEPLITLETKREWQRWALQTGATLFFPHDIARPAGRLTLDDRDRPKLQPVEFAYDNPMDV